MANENDHISKLFAARSRMVAERRSVVTELTGEYKRGHTELLRDQLVKIQTAIEGIDQAIADEKKTGAGEARGTDKSAGEGYPDIPTGGGVSEQSFSYRPGDSNSQCALGPKLTPINLAADAISGQSPSNRSSPWSSMLCPPRGLSHSPDLDHLPVCITFEYRRDDIVRHSAKRILTADRADRRVVVPGAVCSSRVHDRRRRRPVFWIVIIGHGAPPLTRCVVASPGASLWYAARRGACRRAPGAGLLRQGTVLPNSSGSLAKMAAIRRASSRVRSSLRRCR